jgi:glycosyltransferase involved in cell wall biosynthesis
MATATERRQFRLAVLYAGDLDAAGAWSGIPRGLATGFEACGVTVERVSVALPALPRRVLKRLRYLDPEHARLKSAVARRRLARVGALDAVLQLGSDFALPSTVRSATYDDMTVAQYERFDDAWVGAFPRRARRAWMGRQLLAYQQAAVCTVMSQWAADSVAADYGIAASKIAVVGAGVNNLLTPPERRDWRTPHFLVVARDWRRKNVPLVIEVFSEIRERWPDATFDIVGPYDGPAPDGVSRHGSLSLGSETARVKLAKLYDAATCFVMPSIHEPFGVSYAEAACAGVPSIGTTMGGAPEAIGDGGIVVAPDDRAALLAAMERMCDAEVAEAYGRAALAGSEAFRWENVSSRILAALS